MAFRNELLGSRSVKSRYVLFFHRKPRAYICLQKFLRQIAQESIALVNIRPELKRADPEARPFEFSATIEGFVTTLRQTCEATYTP